MFDYIRDLVRLLTMPPSQQGKAISMIKRIRSGRHYLGKCGYWKSIIEEKSVDRDGKPMPWMNYSMIEFLKERLSKDQSVFEYGSGGSSIFFGSHCRDVKSVEHDKKFFDFVRGQMTENVKLILVDADIESYCNKIASDNTKYDVIIIDGLHRNECAKSSLRNLSDSGVVIFDDSQAQEWLPGLKFLRSQGFKELKLTGLKPQSFAGASTSIFYRSDNVFNI